MTRHTQGGRRAQLEGGREGGATWASRMERRRAGGMSGSSALSGRLYSRYLRPRPRPRVTPRRRHSVRPPPDCGPAPRRAAGPFRPGHYPSP